MSVEKKLHTIQSKTRSLAPESEGQTGAAKYNYVSGSKLLSVIRPEMDRLGLILTTQILECHNEVLTYPTSKGTKTEMFTNLHILFTWVDTEDGSRLENHFYANGMNSFDKGLGSALTYAERYYLMKTFHIATDDDDVDAITRDEAEQALPETQPSAPAKTLKEAKSKRYWSMVEKSAKGEKGKNGADPRDTFWSECGQDRDQLREYDEDVERVKAALITK